jgi:glutamine amidotransferase
MGLRIAVVDYGIGNLRSAEKAFQHVGADARLTASAADIAAADAVVLPGVGAFGACIDALEASGLREVVVEAARSGRPFVGICIGLQMLCASSEESPDHLGLAVFDTKVIRIRGDVKLPQMQWNQLSVEGPPHPALLGLGDAPWMYFVHSFAAERCDATVATCDYGGPVTAVLARDSIVAAQFHPEKSGRDGLAFLSNVVTWAGTVH